MGVRTAVEGHDDDSQEDSAKAPTATRIHVFFGFRLTA